MPKEKLLLLLVMIMCFGPCSGQGKRSKQYNVVVKTVFQAPLYRGALLEVRDSAILVFSKNKEIRFPSGYIKQLRFKRQRSVGRGAIVGGATGLAFGAAVGLSGGDELFTKEETALVLGVAFSGIGAGIGALIGAVIVKQKITINGDLRTFQSQQDEMKKYVRTVSRDP